MRENIKELIQSHQFPSMMAEELDNDEVKCLFTQADQILTLITDKIEKMENPQWAGDLHCQLANVSCVPKHSNYIQGCYDTKQKILDMLKGGE